MHTTRAGRICDGRPAKYCVQCCSIGDLRVVPSVVLYTTISCFQSQVKEVRDLNGELGDLNAVLESLLETVTSHPDLAFDAVKIPLHRCGEACQESGELIQRCWKHSTSSRSSVRDWITQQYLRGDLDDFRAMLAGYKSTMNIALANANMYVPTA